MDSSNSQTARMLHSFSGANLPELSTLQAAAVDRRVFLKISVASGFALGAYAGLSSVAQGQTSAATGLKSNQQPNAFLHISEDGTITVQVNRLDFGQGVSTGLPMMLAEELDAEWSKVKSQLAPAAEAYKDPNFGIQMTGGSSAIANSWMQYRELGARAVSVRRRRRERPVHRPDQPARGVCRAVAGPPRPLPAGQRRPWLGSVPLGRRRRDLG